jgi:hypothetical protein
MAATRSAPSFVKQLRSELELPASTGGVAGRVLRRKVAQILRQSGRSKMTSRFRSELQQALLAAGIHTDRPVATSTLFQGEWLSFAAVPFPPESVLFSKEADLCEFIRRGIGRLSGLEGLRELGNEFRVGAKGQKIDLLCEEVAQSRKGDLVAIELKRGDPGYGVKEQLDAYLDALRQHPKARGRQVRGIIISGPDEDAQSAAGATSRNRIDWLYYRLVLEKASPVANTKGQMRTKVTR